MKGIGPKFAQRIVKAFGENTLEVIEDEPERLLEVEGIGKVRVDRIRKSWAEQKEIRNIMLFLQSHNVNTSHATKIFKTYGNESIEVVKENPYRLADDIWGIGFKTADQIAEKMGFGHEKYVRLRSGLLYSLNRLSESGHCYATREMLLKTGAELLAVEEYLLSMTLDEMIRAEDVITETIELSQDSVKEGISEKAIYLPPFYYSEKGTAKRLSAISRGQSGIHISIKGLPDRIRDKTGMVYDDIQMQAILTAVTSKVMILTGGPGTGKTTTTLGIITAFQEVRARILLAAPTGRAAKRLSESTGMEAKTIHRLLEVKPPDGYQKNEEEPLEGDVLIVDECSMIDIMLMYNLLKAVPDTMTLIMVGDIDQLPSVGAGNVLRDIIESECFPVVRLTKIFRQARTSRIIMNAHRINAGRAPDLSNGMQSDFFFMDMEKQLERKGLPSDDSTVVSGEAAETIVDLIKVKLPRYYHTSSDNIQVLTPMQRGVVSAANLNQILQEVINPADTGYSGGQRDQGDNGLRRGGTVYRPKDKVMQIKNNYDKEVFNGDIGVVLSVDKRERELIVGFDGRPVTYDISELDELVLAYATTIHKSQGSEYPIVVMPVLMNHYIMLQRNLIYTGITRAKKVLVLVGTRKAVNYAVRNVTVQKRNTMLKERICKICQGIAAVEMSGDMISYQKILADENPAELPKVAEPVVPYGTVKEPESLQFKVNSENKISHKEWLKIDLFTRIRQSKFRMRFKLKEADIEYIKKKGLPVVKSHAEDFVRKRLSAAEPANDGKQTPMRGAPKGHPVFIAQHATGTCCRECLLKWHGIPKVRELSQGEQEYIVDVLMKWIGNSMSKQ